MNIAGNPSGAGNGPAGAALVLLQAFVDIDPETSIEGLTLWHMSGGRCGTWERSECGETRHQTSASR